MLRRHLDTLGLYEDKVTFSQVQEAYEHLIREAYYPFSLDPNNDNYHQQINQIKTAYDALYEASKGPNPSTNYLQRQLENEAKANTNRQRESTRTDETDKLELDLSYQALSPTAVEHPSDDSDSEQNNDRSGVNSSFEDTLNSEVNSKEEEQDACRKADAFIKIYNALREGQENRFFRKTNFVKDHVKDPMSYDPNELISAITSHKKKNPGSRTAIAWELTEKYYHQGDPDKKSLLELLKEIYQHAFKKSSFFSLSRATGNTFFRSAALSESGALNKLKLDNFFKPKTTLVGKYSGEATRASKIGSHFKMPGKKS